MSRNWIDIFWYFWVSTCLPIFKSLSVLRNQWTKKTRRQFSVLLTSVPLYIRLQTEVSSAWAFGERCWSPQIVLVPPLGRGEQNEKILLPEYIGSCRFYLHKDSAYFLQSWMVFEQSKFFVGLRTRASKTVNSDNKS